MPEYDTQTFEISATRTFEVDYTTAQIDQLMRQTGKETPEAAIATARGEVEAEHIRAVEKLIGIDVTVDGPDDG
jgi:glucan biosynthesis protein